MTLDDFVQPRARGAVALLNPPSPFLLDERVFPTLCLADNGAVLEQHGYHVDLLDLALDNTNPQDWRDETMRIARMPYQAFCITATSPQFMFADEMQRLIRQIKPDAHIVIGGAHPSLVSTLRKTKIAEWIKKDPTLGGSTRLEEMLHDFDPNFAPLEQFDLIYDGDGESAVHQAVDPRWVREQTAKNGKWFSAPMISDLNTLGIPARHLYQMETYNKFSVGGKLAMNVMTQRGCPFACEFCSGRDSPMYRQVRYRSSDHVIRELRHMQKVHEATAFMFFDDEFNLNYKRTVDLCLGMIKLREEEGIEYAWRAFIKSELFVKYPDIAKYMKDAGCVEVCTGVESGSPFILQHVIHKNTSPELNLKAREIAKRTGLRYKAFTMVGHAGETEEDAMKTLAWILEAKPDDFDVTVCTPYPGAPYYDRAVRFDGKIFVYDDSNDRKGNPKLDSETQRARTVRLYFEKPDYSKVQAFYKGVPGEYTSLVWTDDVSPEKFVELRDHIDDTARAKLGLRRIERPSGIDQSMGAPPAYLFSKSGRDTSPKKLA